MATVKKGNLTASPEWWKHLRETKRMFWQGERRAEKDLLREEERDLLGIERPGRETSDNDPS